jgi:hypothetical protein
METGGSIDALEAATGRLHLIATAIRKTSSPAPRNPSKDVEIADDAQFTQYAGMLLRKMFPSAHLSIRQQLENSVTVRRRWILDRTRHEKKLATRREPDNQAPLSKTSVNLPSQIGEDSHTQTSVPTTSLRQQVLRATAVPLSSTNASKFDGKKALQYIHASPALSAISTGSTIKDDTISYPAMPRFEEGILFSPCYYCGEPLQAQELRGKNNFWK